MSVIVLCFLGGTLDGWLPSERADDVELCAYILGFPVRAASYRFFGFLLCWFGWAVPAVVVADSNTAIDFYERSAHHFPNGRQHRSRRVKTKIQGEITGRRDAS